MATATKLSETNMTAESVKKGIHNKANTKGGIDVQIWRRLKRIEVVVFWKLVCPTTFQILSFNV